MVRFNPQGGSYGRGSLELDATGGGGGGGTTDTTKLFNISSVSAQTANFTAVANTKHTVDATGGVVTATLPTTGTLGNVIFIQKSDASTNVVNISGKINGTAATTLPLRTQSQGKLLQFDGVDNWNVIAGDLSLASTDARYVNYDGDTMTNTLNVAMNSVTAGTFANSPVNAAGLVNDTLQLNIQNQSNGTSASSDFIATANTGNDSSNYVDLGINSSAYADTGYTIGGALDGYLYTNGGNLSVGTQSTGKQIVFHTAGTLAPNERLRITDAGLKLPTGTLGYALISDALGNLALAAVGNVVGPASATDTAIATYSGTTGKLIQNSLATVSSTGVGTFASSASGSAPLAGNNSASASFVALADLRATGLAATQSGYFAFGRAASNNNQGSIGFYYAGAGLTTNRIDLNFYGGTQLMSILASGLIGVSQTGPTAYMDLPASTTAAASMRIRVAGTAPTSPNQGDIWVDNTQKTLTFYNSSTKQAPEMVIFSNKQSFSLGNATTQTSVFPATFVGTKTLAANFFASAKGIRIKLQGVYTSVVATTGVTINVKLGTTTVASVNVNALANAATNLAWQGEVTILSYTTGATGTVVCAGGLSFTTGMTGTAFGDLSNGGASTTIDTTVSQVIDVTAAFNSSQTTQDVKVLVSTINVIN